MKKDIFLIVFFASLALNFFIVLAIGSASAAVMHLNEFQVTSNAASQENPDIFDYYIVYQDNRNGNWDIYLYTLQGAIIPESRITTNPANQIEPAICGNIIVYQDDRNGNWDIYMYNITSQTETQITSNASDSMFPAIDVPRIVWQDNRNGNWDVYMFDLVTLTERRVTTWANNLNPAISGNIIVYQKSFGSLDPYDTSDYIAYADLLISEEHRVPDGLSTHRDSDPSYPVIFGNRIVWMAHRWILPTGLQWDISMSRPDGGEFWQTEEDYHQKYPDICDNYIVYEDTDDIYTYDLIANATYRITNDGFYQTKPVVYGGRVVYQDDRNGNLDIYITEISFAVSEPPLVRSVGPSSTLDETENQVNTPDYFTFIFVPVVVAVIAVLIITLYFKKYKNKKTKRCLPKRGGRS